MLLSLEVRDFVIVDRLALEFGPGFTVLTGETGAGKSILVDALGLVLGARADTGVVRGGAERAEISAVFALPAGGGNAPAGAEGEEAGEAGDGEVPGGLRGWLEDQGFPPEDQQLVLRRSLDAGGRSRCWINGRPATAQQLRALGGSLLDIHGQHAHQSLLRPAAQRELLDAFAGAGSAATAVHHAWQEQRRLEEQLADHARRERELADQRDRLAREVDELAGVALSAQDWTDLQQEHARLANAGSLLDTARAGVDRLSEGEDDIIAALHGLSQRLAALEAVDDGLRAPRELVDGAAIALGEAAHALRRYAHGIDSDPARLAALEEQMQRLVSCARRYRLAPEQLGERLAAARAQLADLEVAASRDALEQALGQARRNYREAAGVLGALRRLAARRLSDLVTATIRELAMGDGVFEVALLAQEQGSAHGDEQVEFQLCAFPGQPAGPLARIASGGELSRVSLAIQAALSRVARVPTLVFDEVDSGIGGRVAEIVGRLLHQLAGDCQVMCVTHLAQVAAWADQHLQVAKETTRGVPRSRIAVLEQGERVDEIARMLGGARLTEASRQHARELLDARQAAR